MMSYFLWNVHIFCTAWNFLQVFLAEISRYLVQFVLFSQNAPTLFRKLWQIFSTYCVAVLYFLKCSHFFAQNKFFASNFSTNLSMFFYNSNFFPKNSPHFFTKLVENSPQNFPFVYSQQKLNFLSSSPPPRMVWGTLRSGNISLRNFFRLSPAFSSTHK